MTVTKPIRALYTVSKIYPANSVNARSSVVNKTIIVTQIIKKSFYCKFNMTNMPQKASKKASQANKKMRKRKRPDAVQNVVVEKPELPPATRMSDEAPPKRVRWVNKQRLLVFASRGITYQQRHLMENLREMLPHSRPESKMSKQDHVSGINEICEVKNCNKCIFFSCAKKTDLYMWVSNVSAGPSAKFLVQNVYTMGELKMTGNSLRGSRPLLSFDKSFEELPHYQVLRELLVQTFGTPNQHPKSQPFYDHVITFTVMDNRIWFRNYQIVTEDGSLAEIGPRFVLNPIKIFDSSFGGETLWENPHYISPNQFRMKLKRDMGNKYAARLSSRLDYEQRQPEQIHAPRPLESVFQGNPIEQALRINEERIKKAANEDTESASDDEVAEPVIKPKTNKAGKLKATVAKKAAARKMKKKLKGKK